MIYCVVPERLKDELLERLRDYYTDEPNVEVILERREGERRTDSTTWGGKRRRRDRRRPRIAGTFLSIGPER